MTEERKNLSNTGLSSSNRKHVDHCTKNKAQRSDKVKPVRKIAHATSRGFTGCGTQAVARGSRTLPSFGVTTSRSHHRP
jgi:hypothetical protein